MRQAPSLAILGLAVALAATPATADDTDGTGGFPITLSAPGPKRILDDALGLLAARDLRAADSRIAQAQNRLINDSHSGVLPAWEDRNGMRAAVPVLDGARQAIARGDTQEAVRVVQQARAMF
jgi:hypothetical protein